MGVDDDKAKGRFMVKGAVGRLHQSLDAANEEATRLSQLHGGSAFSILEVVAVVRSTGRPW